MRRLCAVRRAEVQQLVRNGDRDGELARLGPAQAFQEGPAAEASATSEQKRPT